MLVRFADKIYFYLSQCWNFLRPRRKLGLVSFVILASFVLVVWVVSTNVAHAEVFPSWSEIVGWICDLILWVAQLFLKLTFFILSFVIEVAGYNGFIDSNAVIVGWVMVRDITNMFFVVVLLIISFGTILGLEQYEYKKLLVKLLLAAIIVNFSRIICGIVIDVAQVIMITFVNGIAATAGGNMVNMFGVQSIFQLNGNSDGLTGSDGEKFVAAVAAITFSAIMMVTMLTFLLLLMARMLTLWILIVLSPFAFVLNVLPQTQKFAGQWWTEFGGNVVAGPIIAFFLWLSFVTVGAGNVHDQIRDNSSAKMEESTDNPAETSAGITEIMNWEKMANFAIAIGMLLAGAKMAQQLGAAGGSMMGKAYDFGKKVAMTASGLTAARWGAGKAWQGAKGAGKLAAKGLYHGTNLVPLLHAIHPEQWKRRYENTRDKFWTWRQEKLNRKTSEATKISKMFRTNEQGQYVKKVELLDSEGNVVEKDGKIQYEQQVKRDKQGNAIIDKKTGKEVMEDKEVVQSGIGDWLTRQGTRFLLESSPGYRGFMGEMSEDVKETRKATEEQLAHLASGSQLPVGRAKLEAKQKLKELEKTGEGIKMGKEARWEERRDEILDIIEKGGDYQAVLKDMGLDEGDIADAESAVKRRERSFEGKAQEKGTKELLGAEQSKREVEAMAKYMKKGGSAQEEKTAEIKAESKLIQDKLNTEKEIKELQAIYSLIKEGGLGHEKQKEITGQKAMLEQLTFDMGRAKDLSLAVARDEFLTKNNRGSEANNRQSVLAKQVKEDNEKQSVGNDYPRSVIRTGLLFKQKEEARKELEAAKAEKNSEKIKIAKEKYKQSRRSYSQMQASNWEQHGSIGSGNMAAIVKSIDPDLLKNLSINPSDTTSVRKVQAAIFSSLIGDKVDASRDGLEEAVQTFNEIHGNRAEAMLEQVRIALDKAGGQGVFSVAGVLQNELNDKGEIITKVTDVDNKDETVRAAALKYINGRRESARSAAKITTISAGLGGAVDSNAEGEAVVDSDESVKAIKDLLAPLTSTRLDGVDEYIKSSLGGILKNSTVGGLAKLKAALEEAGAARDKGALATLLENALGKVQEVSEENKKFMEKWIKEFGTSVKEIKKPENKQEGRSGGSKSGTGAAGERPPSGSREIELPE